MPMCRVCFGSRCRRLFSASERRLPACCTCFYRKHWDRFCRTLSKRPNGWVVEQTRNTSKLQFLITPTHLTFRAACLARSCSCRL